MVWHSGRTMSLYYAQKRSYASHQCVVCGASLNKSQPAAHSPGTLTYWWQCNNKHQGIKHEIRGRQV